MLDRDKIRPLLDKTEQGCAKSLAKLLTSIEKIGPSLFSVPELLKPKKQSFRLGITGPPGAGKSTLINELITRYRKQGQSVGVLAVDPSSPLSGGAILGDRIRYKDHFLDKDVFIRSLGTRGSLGGLCASAYLMLRAYDLFGFDQVIVETVGVGQSELDIVNVADHISIVLVPESGDSIQMMKAGVLEIADSFVVNKADRPGADSLFVQLKSELSYSETDRAKKLFQLSAIENKGLDEYFDYLKEVCSGDINRLSPEALQREAKAILSTILVEELSQKTQNITNLDEYCSTIEHFLKK